MSHAERCAPDHGCITCSDEAIAMRVLEAHDGDLALCADAAGEPVEVMTDLVAPLAPGAVVLVHAGVALARLA